MVLQFLCDVVGLMNASLLDLFPDLLTDDRFKVLLPVSMNQTDSLCIDFRSGSCQNHLFSNLGLLLKYIEHSRI